MIGEADDLMLSLMQIADEAPAPEPASKAPNALSSLKPYPHHKGECGGMVSVQPGGDEETGEPLLRFFCVKCGKDEIMPMQLKGMQGVCIGDVKAPEWVEPPNV